MGATCPGTGWISAWAPSGRPRHPASIPGQSIAAVATLIWRAASHVKEFDPRFNVEKLDWSTQYAQRQATISKFSLLRYPLQHLKATDARLGYTLAAVLDEQTDATQVDLLQVARIQAVVALCVATWC